MFGSLFSSLIYVLLCFTIIVFDEQLKLCDLEWFAIIENEIKYIPFFVMLKLQSVIVPVCSLTVKFKFEAINLPSGRHVSHSNNFADTFHSTFFKII
jgi:hypothetical protein